MSPRYQDDSPDPREALVFEAFAPADGSVSRRYGGTGLGLPTSASLVAMMEGSIGVISHEGQGGSTFTFTTRAGLAAEQPAAGHARDRRKTDPPAGLQAGLHRLRVLVAEDNLVNQKLAAALLACRGQDAVVVSNGREASTRGPATRSTRSSWTSRCR